jgi:hypothetical protein
MAQYAYVRMNEALANSIEKYRGRYDNKHVTLSQIGALVGVSRETARQYAIYLGWSIKSYGLNKKYDTSVDTKKRVRELMAQGYADVEIREHVNLSGPLLHQIMAEFHGKLRHTKDAIKRMYARGCNFMAIQKRYGLTREYVERVVREDGVKHGLSDVQRARKQAAREKLGIREIDVKHMQAYKKEVRKVTYYAAIQYYWEYIQNSAGKRGKSSRGNKGYHVDHIISLLQGFGYKQPLPLHIVCHPANLAVIPAADNLKKSASVVITKAALLQRIKVMETTHEFSFKKHLEELGYTTRFLRH